MSDLDQNTLNEDDGIEELSDEDLEEVAGGWTQPGGNGNSGGG